MALILFCRVCMEGRRHQGGELPRVCPLCHCQTEWLKATEIPVPKVPYALTGPDARFLAALKIDPEVIED